MERKIDAGMIGATFGHLTVRELGWTDTLPRRRTALCDCECGTRGLVVRVNNLRSGNTQSCGCIQRKHGLWQHPLYNRWNAMMQRCYNPASNAFPNYGGRGIRVCKRWHDFTKFLADMEPTYQPGLEIDRKNNSAGYSPGNCRWATDKQQIANRRVALRITIDGRTQTLAEWAAENGIAYKTAWMRVKEGWDHVAAVTTPTMDSQAAGKRARTAQVQSGIRSILVTIDGETRPLKEWAERRGVSHHLAYDRIKKGWEPLAALTTPPMSDAERVERAAAAIRKKWGKD